jgi:hypothetical protein
MYFAFYISTFIISATIVFFCFYIKSQRDQIFYLEQKLTFLKQEVLDLKEELSFNKSLLELDKTLADSSLDVNYIYNFPGQNKSVFLSFALFGIICVAGVLLLQNYQANEIITRLSNDLPIGNIDNINYSELTSLGCCVKQAIELKKIVNESFLNID